MDCEQGVTVPEAGASSAVQSFNQGNGLGYGVYCAFCGEKPDEEEFGKFFHDEESNMSVHQYCMFFASGLPQRGQDSEGFDGFLIKDILAELRRGYRLRCTYCKMRKACIGCVFNHCRKMFHYSCGKKNGALSQFYGSFNAYCSKHRPQQRLSSAGRLCFTGMSYSTCSICLMPVEAWTSPETLKTPCCKNTWFHRECVQKQAIASGYFFRCAMCNNSEKFQEEMKRMGIYIPEKDAAWEDGEAYNDLLQKYSTCDADVCLSVNGRNYNQEAGKWQVIVCSGCGQCGTHVTCQGWDVPPKQWQCVMCQAITGSLPELDKEEDTLDTTGECVRIQEAESDVEVDVEGLTEEVQVLPASAQAPLVVDEPCCSKQVKDFAQCESSEEGEFSRKTSRFKSYRLKGVVESEEDSDGFFYETLFEEVLNNKREHSSGDFDEFAKPRMIEGQSDVESGQEFDNSSDFFNCTRKAKRNKTSKGIGGRKFRRLSTDSEGVTATVSSPERTDSVFENMKSSSTVADNNSCVANAFTLHLSPEDNHVSTNESFNSQSSNSSKEEDKSSCETSSQCNTQGDFEFVSPVDSPRKNHFRGRLPRGHKVAKNPGQKEITNYFKQNSEQGLSEKSESDSSDSDIASTCHSSVSCPPPPASPAPSPLGKDGLSETVKQALQALAKALGNNDCEMESFDDIVCLVSETSKDSDSEDDCQDRARKRKRRRGNDREPAPQNRRLGNTSRKRQHFSSIGNSLNQFSNPTRRAPADVHQCLKLNDKC